MHPADDVLRCLFVSGLLGSVACGGAEPASPALVAPAACTADCIELGTGETTFRALTDGDSIDVVAGIQGGFHITGSVRVKGVHPGAVDAFVDDNPVVSFDVLVGDTPIDQSNPLAMGLAEVVEGQHERVGRRVLLDAAVVEPYDAFHETPLTVRVTVTDTFGTAHSTSLRLRANCRF